MNLRLAHKILQELLDLGVREFCVCAGARNAPFVEILSQNLPPELKVYYHFEERSSGFFALGRIKASDQPVAVITTSGTAAAELLPAVIEAYYSGLPLVAVTADRPKHHRGSGGPQTIEQVGIYSHYVCQTIDYEGENFDKCFEEENTGSLYKNFFHGPTHFNVCFSEPLIDLELKELKALVVRGAGTKVSPGHDLSMTSWPQNWPNTLAIVGPLPPKHQEAAFDFLNRQQIPYFCEGLSGLRGRPSMYQVEGASWQTEALLSELSVDHVLRIGGVPTLRLWRDLEEKYKHLKVSVLSHLKFSGLSRPDVKMYSLQGQSLRDGTQKVSSSTHLTKFISDWNNSVRRELLALIEEFPLSEPAQVYFLSRIIPAKAQVYLGNSLPVREWDLMADETEKNFFIQGNRGANGIDGQLSTFFGYASPASSNWGIFGDLTALYDLSAPWLLRDRPVKDLTLIVINNGGGKIFAPMFNNSRFENRHQISFEGAARLWGFEYLPLKDVRDLSVQTRAPRWVELVPSDEQTNHFWRKFSNYGFGS